MSKRDTGAGPGIRAAAGARAALRAGPHRDGRAAKFRTAESAPAAPAARRSAARGPGKEARRADILKAGLHVFAEHGFVAARLDDVARRAGVAKGTLYLYFKDKSELFEEIVRDAAAPVIQGFERVATVPDIPTAQVLEGMFALFAGEVLGTDRKLVLRLVISEGPRFPRIAQFYHREVVARGLAILRRVAERGRARGELADDTLARFPQLVLAGPLLALLWDGLFARIEPLDVASLLQAHCRLLTAPAAPPPSPPRSLAP